MERLTAAEQKALLALMPMFPERPGHGWPCDRWRKYDFDNRVTSIRNPLIVEAWFGMLEYQRSYTTTRHASELALPD